MTTHFYSVAGGGRIYPQSEEAHTTVQTSPNTAAPVVPEVMSGPQAMTGLSGLSGGMDAQTMTLSAWWWGTW